MERIDLVEYFEGNDLHFGRKISQQNNRLLLEKGSKQQVKLSQSRVLFTHSRLLTEDISATIKELAELITSYKQGLNILDLWELTIIEQRDYSIEELASFLDDDPDSVIQSALFQAIREEKKHFKLRGRLATPRSLEQIEEIEIQEKRETEKMLAFQFFNDNLGKAMRGESDVDDRIFSQLKEWLTSQDSPSLTTTIEKYANGQDTRFFVYNVLKKNQKISTDDDKFAIIYGISSQFSPQALADAESLTINLDQRDDLSQLTCYTIDSDDTKEIDDAISLDYEGSNLLIGVHITDLASYIPKDSPLDREAGKRVSTIYLQTGEIPMLPVNISHAKLSLIAGEKRPTVSGLFTFSPKLELVESQIVLGYIKVSEKISYDEFDKVLRKNKANSQHPFQQLKELTESLKKRRFENGAIEINRPEVEIKVVDDQIKLSTTNNRSQSRKIIGELMILFNSTMADYAVKNKLPLLFRVQEMPNEDYKHFLQPDYYDPILNDKLIKLIRPSYISSLPEKHYGLGLECYSQITSPLRRFFDLVIQRQLVTFMKFKQICYSQEELLGLIPNIEETNKRYSQLYTSSFNYWFLKYLEQNLSYEPLPAVVVNDNDNSYTCELLSFGKRYNVRSRENLHVGDEVSLIIEKICPEKEMVKFSIMND